MIPFRKLCLGNNVLLPIVRFPCWKHGPDFSLQDKQLFEISEVDMTRVDCICKADPNVVRKKNAYRYSLLSSANTSFYTTRKSISKYADETLLFRLLICCLHILHMPQLIWRHITHLHSTAIDCIVCFIANALFLHLNCICFAADDSSYLQVIVPTIQNSSYFRYTVSVFTTSLLRFLLSRSNQDDNYLWPCFILPIAWPNKLFFFSFFFLGISTFFLSLHI